MKQSTLTLSKTCFYFESHTELFIQRNFKILSIFLVLPSKKNIISSGWKTHVSHFLKLLYFWENLVVVGVEIQGTGKGMRLSDSYTMLLKRNYI